MARRDSSAGKLAATAADASGNLAGAGLAALVAGPEEIIAGALVGPSVSLALKQAVAQISGWARGRQVERVSEAIRVAAVDLEQTQAEGREIREDFRERDGQAPRSAEEVAEGILQIAALSYEQRKAPYLGHLLASIAVACIRCLARLADLSRPLSGPAAPSRAERQLSSVWRVLTASY